jgi:hypothetical protein
MSKMTVAVVVHLVLLALACTSFTLISVWTSGAWTCNFYAYRYADGWGYVYQSDFTLPVIIMYLAAYVAGLAVYAIAWRAGSRYIAGTGLALWIVGLASLVAQSLVDCVVPCGHVAVGRGRGCPV